jgi:hypothetical protein
MSTTTIIRWTRQDDGSYGKEGTLPAEVPTARIFEIDEDYETNPDAVSPGLKLRPKEEAVALVEGKIADGSYQAWRYEIRPEISNAETPPASALAPSESSAARLCSNPRCKKGPDGTPSIVKSRRAKYCCRYCRVDVCRRNRPKPQQTEKPKRKRRRDAKWKDHAERQREYQARHSLVGLPQVIRDMLWMKARRARTVDGRVQEPA